MGSRNWHRLACLVASGLIAAALAPAAVADKGGNGKGKGCTQPPCGEAKGWDNHPHGDDEAIEPQPAQNPPPPSQPPPSAAAEAKVDPELADAAEAAGDDPDAVLSVIVFGPDPQDSIRAADATATHTLGSLHATSVSVRADELPTLAAGAGVNYVMLDAPVAPTARRGSAFGALATLYPRVDRAPSAWERRLSGRGVGIAIVDSGVDPTADLGGSRLVQARLDGQSESVADTFGHGTFVAGIAAGSSADRRYRGIAPGSTIYGVDVARGGTVRTSDVLAGLEWVLANHARDGIRVVSLSLSETRPSSYVASPLDTAVEQLWQDGVVVVASAGNLGPGTAVFAPANDPRVITVGAVDANDTPSTADDAVASFSSSGTTLDGFAKPDLLAPGRHVVSLLPAGTALAAEAPAANLVAPGYAMMSGTSFSAPQVAGAAALLLQQHPGWTPDQVKWVLTRTARALAGSDAGALDVAAAARFRGAPRAANAGIEPATFGLGDATTTALEHLRGAAVDAAARWTPPAWNGSSWNGSSWNGSSWNGSSWNGSSWNGSSWNASSWN